MVAQINDLAQLQQGNFTPELMQSFFDRSSTLLGAIGNDAPLENAKGDLRKFQIYTHRTFLNVFLRG